MSEMKGRQWAEKVLAAPERTYSPGEVAAAKVVVEHTAPLTMADVDWDDEKHRLAGANTSTGQEVVMMWYDPKHTDHIISARDEWRREQLTPNGKRYELREVTDEPTQATVSLDENVGADQPEHPTTLKTLEDYANAPAGTVVAEPLYFAWQKNHFGDWRTVKTRLTSREMAGRKRQVLRWGWGK